MTNLIEIKGQCLEKNGSMPPNSSSRLWASK